MPSADRINGLLLSAKIDKVRKTMIKQIMPVMISCEPAAPCWGEGALLSSSDKGMTIHLKHAGKLCAVQSAGRKLDGQGIRNVALAGEGWDLEKAGHFGKVFVRQKGLERLNGQCCQKRIVKS